MSRTLTPATPTRPRRLSEIVSRHYTPNRLAWPFDYQWRASNTFSARVSDSKTGMIVLRGDRDEPLRNAPICVWSQASGVGTVLGYVTVDASGISCTFTEGQGAPSVAQRRAIADATERAQACTWGY